MKKRYKTIKTFIALLTLSAMSMSAQLSGLYTIDKTAPVSLTNYTSVASFAAALNGLGVSGPVTANIVANTGPYNEQVQFNQIVGASASNSIVINGNANVLSFNNNTNAAQLWIVNLNGTDYLTLNNLNINGLGTYAYGIILNGGANFNNFNNCTITCPNESTSSQQIPVVFSGANTTYASAGNSGNDNTFTNCTMKWGYTGVWMYNMTTTPYNGNNKFIDCQILDFYFYGLYSYYGRQNQVKGCLFERLNRTTLTTGYGVYLSTGNLGWMIEKNRIRKLYHANPGYGATCYGIYMTTNLATGTGTMQSTVRNNIVSDMLNNGSTYGIFFSNSNGYVHHNTIALTNLNNTSTGTNYGIYVAGSTTYPADVKNNLTYMKLGGPSTKYPIYYTTTAGINSSNNCWFDQNVGGTTTYYRAANYVSLAALQAAGGEVGSVSNNPNFISPASNNYMPGSYSINDAGTPVGILDDINNNSRSTTVPDVGAIEFLNTPCSGVPGANAVLAPSQTICPFDIASLSFTNANTYTYTGLTFQWQSSTISGVGPFTAVAGATNQSMDTPTTTTNTYYNVVITCTNSNQSINATSGLVQIAGTTTSTVNYFENFEGITGINRLPNCSWYSNSIGSTCLTYTSVQTNGGRLPFSGSKFASFYYLPAGANHFYTNAIYLNAGVTYSTGLMYRTDYYSYISWSDLSIMLGTTQSTTGLVTLVSTNGPAVSPTYKLLSGTFTVATSGLYYISVRATSLGSSSATYLSWDDLFINTPCSLNTASITLASSATQVCNGDGVTLTASGSGNYVWSNGATSAAITVTPNFNTTYVVSATNTITGCSASASQLIQVNPKPTMGIFVTNPIVCKGSSVIMNAFGATGYNWNSGGSSYSITVSPTVSTSYTVLGVNQFGCTSNAVQLITVKNLPVINTGATTNQMCIGESATLTASGGSGNNYLWNSVSSTIAGSLVIVSPMVSTNYVVTGTNSDGCSNTATVSMAVSECTGIDKLTTTANGVKLYPNPSKGEFNVEFTNSNDKTVELIDLTGRVIMTNTSKSNLVNFNMSQLANGVYYVKIQNNKSTEVVKVVKQ